MAKWANPDDVRKRWVVGELDATDVQVGTKIEDAEDLVLTEYPDVQSRIDSGTLRLETVIRVVSGMVVRFFRNPEGLRTTGSTTGPFSETNTVTYGGEEPGELYLTDADRGALGSRRKGRAFTVSTIPAGWF